MLLPTSDLRRGHVILDATLSVQVSDQSVPSPKPAQGTRVKTTDQYSTSSPQTLPALCTQQQQQVFQHLVFYTPLANGAGARDPPERVRISPEGGTERVSE